MVIFCDHCETVKERSDGDVNEPGCHLCAECAEKLEKAIQKAKEKR